MSFKENFSVLILSGGKGMKKKLYYSLFTFYGFYFYFFHFLKKIMKTIYLFSISFYFKIFFSRE